MFVCLFVCLSVCLSVCVCVLFSLSLCDILPPPLPLLLLLTQSPPLCLPCWMPGCETRDDLSGMDVARKALILSRVAGWQREMSDLSVEVCVCVCLVRLSCVSVCKHMQYARKSAQQQLRRREAASKEHAPTHSTRVHAGTVPALAGRCECGRLPCRTG